LAWYRRICRWGVWIIVLLLGAPLTMAILKQLGLSPLASLGAATAIYVLVWWWAGR
jgi:hypothetical protein